MMLDADVHHLSSWIHVVELQALPILCFQGGVKYD